MFFGKRKKFNGRVASILPAFGFTLDEAGVIPTLNTLDIAWEQQYTDNEAALLVAYSVYGGMLERKESRAEDVFSKISYIQKEWISNGTVSPLLVEKFSMKANEFRQRFG